MPTGRTATSRPGSEGGRGRVDEWHVLQRSLPVTAASARLARVTVGVACRAWRVPSLQEPAVLVASELVTTALRHAPPGLLTLRVLMTPRRLRVEVHDPSGSVPLHPRSEEDGRALAVVADASVRCGVELRLPGVQLWAELAAG